MKGVVLMELDGIFEKANKALPKDCYLKTHDSLTLSLEVIFKLSENSLELPEIKSLLCGNCPIYYCKYHPRKDLNKDLAKSQV